MKGTRILMALAVAVPFFFSPWVELTTLDQPARVDKGSAFTATVGATAHVDGYRGPLDTTSTTILPMPPAEDFPTPARQAVTLRLGVLVPEGWGVSAVTYSATPPPFAPGGAGSKGSLKTVPEEAWVYEAYRSAPAGYEWTAFGGVEYQAGDGDAIRFAVEFAAADRDGRYDLVYGTWSHPPHMYLEGVAPPDQSLVAVPPPSFVEGAITVGEVGPPPHVVSFDPPDGAADVPVDSDIRVTFDRDMDLDSLRNGGLQLFEGPVWYATDAGAYGRGGPVWQPETRLDPDYVVPPWGPMPVPADVFWNSSTRTAVLSPQADLRGHTVHTVLVTYDARAVDGVPVDTNRAATFLTERTPDPPFFSDVPPDHRFRLAIETLFDAGVISGRSDGTFGPDERVTRGQLATMLVRLLGLHTPEPEPSPPYTDLPDPADDVGADYVAEAAKAGITSGFDDGTFRPYAPVTRVQMTRMIVRAAQIYMAAPPPGFSPDFVDVDPADQGFVNWAVFNDLADGKAPGRFDPWSTATRGHAARLLYGVWKITPRPYPPPELP
ncbi:MAG: S-layer homology domain-containing protein [Thermoleophilia bacterium]